jgi:hypothetical protein
VLHALPIDECAGLRTIIEQLNVVP